MSDWTNDANDLAARWEHGHTELTTGCALCEGEWAELSTLMWGKPSGEAQ